MFILKKKNRFMKNIFENAKFGDVFIAMDGKEVKFIMADNHKAVLLEEDSITGRQRMLKCNLDGTVDYGEVEILHKAAPKPMTEEYLLNKGYSKYLYTSTIEYISSNSQIMVRHGHGVTNSPSCNWHVHVDNHSFDSIGSLDFEYIEEFESFLKLCGVENYD